MNKYNFNYLMSIYNAMYYLFGRKYDLYSGESDLLLWYVIMNKKGL